MLPGALLCAVMLDKIFGDPRRFHPLAGFGRIAAWVEARMNTSPEKPGQRLGGVLAVLLLLAPLTAISYFISQIPFWGWFAQIVLLYFALGMTSLAQHARAVHSALDANDLAAARAAVGMIVSRDTYAMQNTDAARAAVESVLENGNDAVFGAVFWFVVAGPAGAVAYRLANTLDAMWGYRTPRYYFFGWAAAHLDDGLNFIPARLTALTYALLGNARRAWQCWRIQARLWYSPNAGPVMASGAGALGVVLGGAARYHGAEKERPTLGIGQPAQAADIGRAISLVQRGLWLWIALIFAGAFLHA
ncbi:MAG: cobalamin biosynthesis protein [Hydrogenophilales bacterium]|nr:cobalamin biosynthesis protein [Hydrogenophilales bacterium]